MAAAELFPGRFPLIFASTLQQGDPMKATIVGLVTPHLLRVLDIAKLAETGANIDWHLRDAVMQTVQELGQQFNARDLLASYVHGLETAAGEAPPVRKAYADAQRAAAAIAARDLDRGD